MNRRKFWDIDHPPVVLLAGEDDRIEPLERRLLSETDYSVETATEASAALARLGRRPAVECLWVSTELPDATGIELVEAATERDTATSVVFGPVDGDERVAARATAAGATEYVSASTAIDDCVERIETAVDRAIDRRHDAEKRSVLDSMVSQFDASLYVKDERARAVVYPEDGGHHVDDPFGKTDPEAYPSAFEEMSESYRDDLRVVETGEPIEWKIERFAESDEWMWSNKVPWTEDGRTRGLVGLTLRITEFKRRERELVNQIARLQQIPDYINHDLKNPMGIAKGYLDLAREGDESTLNEVDDALDRMEELLDDFYSLATQEVGTSNDQRPHRLRPIVEEIWGYVTTDEAVLELEIHPDTYLVADDAHLRPLLKNLLGNAVDHAGPDVTVRVGLLENGFYVEDDGPGIPDAEREEVFEQGYTTAMDGTGLGLVIVREAAHDHGWTVAIDDHESPAIESSGDPEGRSAGTRFRIEQCLIGTPLDVAPTDESYELTESVDVGDVDVSGTAVVDDGSYVVTGAGENIWGDTNEFHFLHATAENGVRIQGRIAGLERVSEWSKAVLMVRSGLDADGAYGFVGRIAGECPEVGWRTEPGEPGRNHQIRNLSDEYDWFRIERVDDQVSCSISTDGERWEFVDRRRIAFDGSVAVGLAVCSVASGEAIEAEFEDVSVVGLEE